MTREQGIESSQLTLWACEGDETVQPSDRPAEPSVAPAPTMNTLTPARADDLWERIFDQGNLLRALQRVVANGGAPGADGMEVEALRPHFDAHWPEIRRQLDSGRYRPTPFRRIAIPKSGGGERELGVPTVMDRLICQATLQVLAPIFDPGFSEASFGFRPRRSAHMAVEAARRHIEAGWEWVVDLDLDSFFDRVNHDALMARVARKVGDRRVLKLIRTYLNTGVMVDGVKANRRQGTPQGSPLSPLLANIMLDDFDRELERRGHRFVRYADDIRIYVRSQRAGQRVLDGATQFIEKRLKLKVNRRKSGVAPALGRGLLGFRFYRRKGSDEIRVMVDDKAIKAVKVEIRRLTDRHWGVSMRYRIAALNRFIGGWCAYFAFSSTAHSLRDLDAWLRRRMRQVCWKQWKRPRTKIRMLLKLGVPRYKAFGWGLSSLGSWRVSASVLQWVLPTAYWNDLGLTGFVESYRRVQAVWRTA